jgi:hypothetical protein
MGLLERCVIDGTGGRGAILWTRTADTEPELHLRRCTIIGQAIWYPAVGGDYEPIPIPDDCVWFPTREAAAESGLFVDPEEGLWMPREMTSRGAYDYDPSLCTVEQARERWPGQRMEWNQGEWESPPVMPENLD